MPEDDQTGPGHGPLDQELRATGIDSTFLHRHHVHVGPVVVGEMGDLHPEIVFLGDTVNTTARIEAASGELHRDVLASRDLVDRLPGLPAGVVSVALGPDRASGKAEALELCAIERTATSTRR